MSKLLIHATNTPLLRWRWNNYWRYREEHTLAITAIYHFANLFARRSENNQSGYWPSTLCINVNLLSQILIMNLNERG